MESCNDCLRLENRLRRASEHYVRLILQQDRMIRDGDAEASAFEDAMREGESWRNAAPRLLLAHRKGHEDSSRPKTRTAGQL